MSAEAIHEQQLKMVGEALKIGIETERDRCAKIASEWLHGPTMLLRAGEMTLQEKRTAMAVVAAIYVAIREPMAEVSNQQSTRPVGTPCQHTPCKYPDCQCA
jgi:hypothetical protein